jgi:hypothetical protein
MLKLARFGERLRSQSNMNFETKHAVKRLAAKPQNNTTAKPLTGPVPNRNRNKMETIVGDVRVDNRGERFVESGVHRRNDILATPQFFPNSLKDQHIGIDCPCQSTARHPQSREA